MFSMHVHSLLGKCLPVLLALQPAAGGGGGGGGGGGARGGGGGGSGGLFNLLLPVILIAFMYFFIMRPMQKQKKEQESLNRSLQKGDRVVMNSGILGTITGIDERYVTVEIAEKVRVKFLRDAIARKDDTAATGSAATSTAAPAKKS